MILLRERTALTMKKNTGLGWTIAVIVEIIGLILFITAKTEIAGDSYYTWTPPYTPYEARVLITKWIGLGLLIAGIVWEVLKVFQIRYTNNHTQEIDQVVKRGGITICVSCGLTLTADAVKCPRCGREIR